MSEVQLLCLRNGIKGRISKLKMFLILISLFYIVQEVGAGRKGPVPLDSLSRDELTTKCKQLLQLAQKAKQAKDGMFHVKICSCIMCF